MSKIKSAGSFASQILITNYLASWALLSTFKRMEGRKNLSVVEHKTMNQRIGVRIPAPPGSKALDYNKPQCPQAILP